MKTENITQLFEIRKCKSQSLESYTSGKIPFVSSTVLNNGVEKFVESQADNEIIADVPCIAMNGFGQCTVQKHPFIGAGNNGAYVKALVPLKPMNQYELAWYASQLNLQSWRFSYGRLAIKERVAKLNLGVFDIQDAELEKFVQSIKQRLGLSVKGLQ